MINLLPWREIARKKTKHYFIAALLGGCLLSVSGIATWRIILMKHSDVAEHRNAQLQQAINNLMPQAQMMKQLQASKSALQKQIIFSQEIKQQNVTIKNRLVQLMKTIPEGVFLTQLKQEPGDTLLIGEADSSALVNDFMRELQKAIAINITTNPTTNRVTNKVTNMAINTTTHILLKGMEKSGQHEKFSLLLSSDKA